jgi:hypothetical protein
MGDDVVFKTVREYLPVRLQEEVEGDGSAILKSTSRLRRCGAEPSIAVLGVLEQHCLPFK